MYDSVGGVAHQHPPPQVDGEQSLDDVKAILEVDSDIPMAEQVLVNQNNVVTGCDMAHHHQPVPRMLAGPLQHKQGCVMATLSCSFAGSLHVLPPAAAMQAPAVAPLRPCISTPTTVQLSTLKHSSTFSWQVRNQHVFRVYNVSLYLSPTDKMQLSMLDMQLPALAAAVKARDSSRLQQLLRESHAAKQEALRKQELLLTGDPMDPEVQVRFQQGFHPRSSPFTQFPLAQFPSTHNVSPQALIAEQIHQKAIDENLEQAMEYSPEAFAHVFMLYVNAEVNGHKFKAFVDSGAQMSIMTLVCAERCNLSRLIDRRYQGIAKGVGESKIVGRIHQAPLKVEGQFLPLAVSVLEQKGGPQFIIGLDMLKRYQVCVERSVVRDDV